MDGGGGSREKGWGGSERRDEKYQTNSLNILNNFYFQREMDIDNRLLLKMIFEMKVFDIVK